MAPADLTDRKTKSAVKSSGIKITSVSVKKGRRTMIKYSWTYDDAKSPGEFAVALINLGTKEKYFLDMETITRDHGKGNTGTDSYDITFMKDYPLGIYMLVFQLVDFDTWAETIAKSKAFYLRKTDF
ncbi:hypothetical protein FS837_000426 [Tulasnella sp. UAMH 9824]|nr:hypothetical protein FS837_000426 [Tulasnella sp. UAMH 9824]